MLGQMMIGRPIGFTCALVFLTFGFSSGVIANSPDSLLQDEQKQYLVADHPRRLALVIGNSAYQNHDQLPGVQKDIEEMEERFRDLGFDHVSPHHNLADWEAFTYDALKPFRGEVRRGDFVVVYLSGHGFAFNGFQYFVPSQFPEKVRDDQVAITAIPVSAIIDSLASEGAAGVLVLLDACRTISDDIIEDSSGNTVPKGRYNRDGRAFQTNYILAMATEDGQAALGSNDSNEMSVYTKALVDHLKVDTDFRFLHDDVEYDVQRATGGQQRPGLHEYSMSPFFMSTSADWLQQETEKWLSLLDERDRGKIEWYADRRALSPYAKAARLWLSNNLEVVPMAQSLVSPNVVSRAWEEAAGPVSFLSSDIRFNGSANYVAAMDSQFKDLFVETENLVSPNAFIDLSPNAGQLSNYARWIETMRGPEVAYLPADSELRAMPSFDADLYTPQVGAQALSPERFAASEQQRMVARDVEKVVTRNACLVKGRFSLECIQNQDVQVVISETEFVPDPDYVPTSWLEVKDAEDTAGFFSLDTQNTSYAFEIGTPSVEVTFGPRSAAQPDMIDIDVFDAEVRARSESGARFSWAAVSVPSALDAAQDTNFQFMVSNLKYHLKSVGVPAENITTLFADPTVTGEGIRLRLFEN